MEVEYALVFWSLKQGGRWEPVERDSIPDALKDDKVIKRMAGGEMVFLAGDVGKDGDRWYKVTQFDCPRPAGQRDARKQYSRALFEEQLRSNNYH